ncbi:MAG: putative addiction module antidote protein [Chloroflexi bacterium]|nr:putative addiction module antidote protein [Chloroflexota bacterium]
MMKTKKEEFKKWDPINYMETEEDMIAYLSAALEDGDTQVISAALGDVARAKGIASVSEKSGLSRTSLYKSLSKTGNPQLSTFLEVVKALNFKLELVSQEKKDFSISR